MYFLEITSDNKCQQGHAAALLHCPDQFRKMPSHSKVTEALRQVVQMKSGGLPLFTIGRNAGRSKSVILRILKLHNDTNSFNITKKAGLLRQTSSQEDRMIQKLSIGDRFGRAAGIFQYLFSNLGKEVSRHTVSRRLSQVERKARSPAIKPLISKAKLLDFYLLKSMLRGKMTTDPKFTFSDESKFNLVDSEFQMVY